MAIVAGKTTEIFGLVLYAVNGSDSTASEEEVVILVPQELLKNKQTITHGTVSNPVLIIQQYCYGREV